MTNRRDRAREVLGDAYEAAGYGHEAIAFRAGIWTCHDHPALAAMLAFADAELDRAAIAAHKSSLLMLKPDVIADAIRAMKEE